MRRPVDHDVGQVGQQLGGGELVCREGEESRVPLDEACGGAARQELRVAEHVFQEEDVGLHSADVELVERALHLLHRVQEGVGLADHLDEERVVVARDDVPGGHRAVEADSWAPGGAVRLDPPGVGLELALRVLCCVKGGGEYLSHSSATPLPRRRVDRHASDLSNIASDAGAAASSSQSASDSLVNIRYQVTSNVPSFEYGAMHTHTTLRSPL